MIGFNPDHAVLDMPSVAGNAHLVNPGRRHLRRALEAGVRPHCRPPRHERCGRRPRSRAIGRTIRGLFELGVSFAGNGHLMVSDATFRRQFNRPKGSVEFGLVRLKPGADAAAVQADLTARLPGDVQVLTRAQFEGARAGLLEHEHADRLHLPHRARSSACSSARSSSTRSSTPTSATTSREYATLKAMGYSDRYSIGVVLQQALDPVGRRLLRSASRSRGCSMSVAARRHAPADRHDGAARDHRASG